MSYFYSLNPRNADDEISRLSTQPQNQQPSPSAFDGLPSYIFSNPFGTNEGEGGIGKSLAAGAMSVVPAAARGVLNTYTDPEEGGFGAMDVFKPAVDQSAQNASEFRKANIPDPNTQGWYAQQSTGGFGAKPETIRFCAGSNTG